LLVRADATPAESAEQPGDEDDDDEAGDRLHLQRVANFTVEDYVLSGAGLQQQVRQLAATCALVNYSQLKRQLAWISGQVQQSPVFGIRARCRSPSHWAQSCEVLKGITLAETPSAILHVLLSTTRKIYATFKAEQQTGLEAPPLGADDFLPVLTYIVSHSGVSARVCRIFIDTRCP
jgi:hypothetical protein